ncbi:MAG: site-2 protease family protein [Myxococcota bacterium]
MKAKEWIIPLGLFVTTLATTTITGIYYSNSSFSHWWQGFKFSIPLIFILLTHELGHYLNARKENISVSLPHFIPLPPFIGIGTLGAVIKIREQITKRNSLMKIGAGGPIWGIIASIPVLIIGIWLSPIQTTPLLSDQQIISEGNSILYIIIKQLIHGTFLPSNGQDIILHPVAFAGWIGLLITMINLIPIGQLDGGHVATAWFGNKYKKFSLWLHRTLPVIGILIFIHVFATKLAIPLYKKSIYLLIKQPSSYTLPHLDLADTFSSSLSASLPWFIWPFLLYILAKISGSATHPPVNNDKLQKSSQIIGIAVIILFILIFMPIPMEVR